jgi:magnesium transporter
MNIKILSAELRKLLGRYFKDNNLSYLNELCRDTHPADIVETMKHMSHKEILFIITNIDSNYASKIFSYMKSKQQKKVLADVSDEKIVEIIELMYPDDRVDLLENIPEDRSEIILKKVAKKDREDILTLKSYEDGTAGSIMTSEYASINENATIGEAIAKIRKEAPEKETINYIYVIDNRRKLLGFIPLRKLIVAKSTIKVKDILSKNLIKSYAEDNQEEVAKKMKKYDLSAIPVTDKEDKLVGIITHDDIQDVIIEEATEDFHKFGGVTIDRSDSDYSLKSRGIINMVSKRIPWLLILVFMNIFTGAGIAYFENTIQSAVSLLFFLPLLIGSAGNAGSQSATLTIRAIATGDIKLKDWFNMFLKEMIVAISIGIIMGLAVSFIGFFRVGPEITIIVAITMVINVFFGSIVGMSLPFILTLFKMDPATASAPLITSIADIGGVIIYFSIATWFLKDIISVVS